MYEKSVIVFYLNMANISRRATHIGVGAGGGRGIGPPLSGLGDNPPTFCRNIGKKYQNLLRIA